MGTNFQTKVWGGGTPHSLTTLLISGWSCYNERAYWLIFLCG